jgi:hypothetical protein
VCGSHRDHQNALQRERYKNVKKSPKQNSSQTPKKKTARKLRPATLKRSQNKVQSVARGDDVELLRDANARELYRNDERRWEAEDDHPLNVGAEQTAAAVTSPSPAPVSRSSGATSDSRAEEPLSTLGGCCQRPYPEQRFSAYVRRNDSHDARTASPSCLRLPPSHANCLWRPHAVSPASASIPECMWASCSGLREYTEPHFASSFASNGNARPAILQPSDPWSIQGDFGV